MSRSGAAFFWLLILVLLTPSESHSERAPTTEELTSIYSIICGNDDAWNGFEAHFTAFQDSQRKDLPLGKALTLLNADDQWTSGHLIKKDVRGTDVILSLLEPLETDNSDRIELGIKLYDGLPIEFRVYNIRFYSEEDADAKCDGLCNGVADGKYTGPMDFRGVKLVNGQYQDEYNVNSMTCEFKSEPKE